MTAAAGLRRHDPVLDAAVDLRLRLAEIGVVPSYGRLGVRRGLGGADEPTIAKWATADRCAGIDRGRNRSRPESFSLTHQPPHPTLSRRRHHSSQAVI